LSISVLGAGRNRHRFFIAGNVWWYGYESVEEAVY